MPPGISDSAHLNQQNTRLGHGHTPKIDAHRDLTTSPLYHPNLNVATSIEATRAGLTEYAEELLLKNRLGTDIES
jgi:hypothetical protein